MTQPAVDQARSTAREMGARLSAATRESFVSVVADGLGELFPSDLIVHSDVDFGAQRVVIAGNDSLSPSVVQTLLDVASDHPIVQSYTSNPDELRPRRISDLVSQRVFESTATYSELFRPLSSRFHLSILTVRLAENRGRIWALNRESMNYSDLELETATAIQPMLMVLDAVSEEAAALPTHDPNSLSPREVEVLELVSRGWTAVRVARALSVSPATVRKHLEHIYAKVGCHGRLMAVDHARELGLLPSR